MLLKSCKIVLMMIVIGLSLISLKRSGNAECTENKFYLIKYDCDECIKRHDDCVEDFNECYRRIKYAVKENEKLIDDINKEQEQCDENVKSTAIKAGLIGSLSSTIFWAIVFLII